MCVHTVLLLFGTFPDAAASLFFRSNPLIIQLVLHLLLNIDLGATTKPLLRLKYDSVYRELT